jgi:hypothetical protein
MRAAAFFPLVVALLLVATDARGEASIEPRLAVGALWTDNVELAPPDQAAEEEFVVELQGSLRISQRSARLRSFLDYQLRHYEFTEDGDRNSTFHQLDATFDFEMFRDWLFLNGTAGYAQQILDPRRPINASNNVFDVGNLADALTAQLAPRLRHEFQTFEIDALYTRGIVQYERRDDPLGAGVSDLDLDIVSVRIGSLSDADERRWGLLYRKTDNDYESAPDYRYEQAAIEGGIALSGTVQLLGEVGLESDLPVSPSAGGLDSNYWLAGFRWSPSERTEVIVRGGRRFFGTAFEGSATRESRLLRLRLSYSETPTTEGQTFAEGFGVAEPDPAIQTELGDRFGTLTTEPFINRVLNSSAALTGRRTTFAVGITSSEREYISDGRTERREGANLRLDRRMTTRSTLSVSVAADRTRFPEGGADDTLEFRVGVTRRLAPQLSVSLDIARFRRDGDFLDYSATLATLRIVKDFFNTPR